jgi:hypothetical protein
VAGGSHNTYSSALFRDFIETASSVVLFGKDVDVPMERTSKQMAPSREKHVRWDATGEGECRTVLLECLPGAMWREIFGFCCCEVNEDTQGKVDFLAPYEETILPLFKANPRVYSVLRQECWLDELITCTKENVQTYKVAKAGVIEELLEMISSENRFELYPDMEGIDPHHGVIVRGIRLCTDWDDGYALSDDDTVDSDCYYYDSRGPPMRLRADLFEWKKTARGQMT